MVTFDMECVELGVLAGEIADGNVYWTVELWVQASGEDLSLRTVIENYMHVFEDEICRGGRSYQVDKLQVYY